MAVSSTARSPSWLLIAAALPFLFMFVLKPVRSAPTENNENTHALDTYDGSGCYYNYQHYGEGDRIITNEPCLNCTCHNRMLMCYLRVCPFTKAIGQDCTVEKKADQCCPVITCPEVPVQLLGNGLALSTTSRPSSQNTAVGHPDSYGCSIENEFYADGAQVPADRNKPCELCYCIRNHTACVMQECTLQVEGCKPVYQDGVCCPVRYECEYPDETTTLGSIASLFFTTTTTMPPNTVCRHNGEEYADGASIQIDDKPCEHCYCMRGEIVCAVQECGTPLEREGHNCTALPTQPGKCCPEMYQCDTGIEYVMDTTNRMNRKQYGYVNNDTQQTPHDVSNDDSDGPQLVQQDGLSSGVALNSDEDEKTQEIKTESPDHVSYVEPKPGMQSDNMVHVDEKDKEEVTTLPPTMIEPVDSEKDAALPVHDAQTPHKPIQGESDAQQEPAQIVTGVDQEHQDAGIQHEPTHDDDDEYTHEDDAAEHQDQIGEVSKPTEDGFKPDSLPSHDDSNTLNRPSDKETAHEDATFQPTLASVDATVQPALVSEESAVQHKPLSDDSAVQHEPAHDGAATQPALASEDATVQPAMASEDATVQPAFASEDATVQPALVSDDSAVQHEPAHDGAATQHETAEEGEAIQHEPTHHTDIDSHLQPTKDVVNETADKETQADVLIADKDAQALPESTEQSVKETTENGVEADVENVDKDAQVNHEPSHTDDETHHGATQDDIKNKPANEIAGEELKPAHDETEIDHETTSEESTAEFTTISSVNVQEEVSSHVKPADSSFVNQDKPEEQAHNHEEIAHDDQLESADDDAQHENAKPSQGNTEEFNETPHKDVIENNPVENQSQNDDDQLVEVTTKPTDFETSVADSDINAQSTDRPNKQASDASLAHDVSDDQDQKETENTTDPQEIPVKQDEHQTDHISNESGQEKPVHDGMVDIETAPQDEVESTTPTANFVSDEVSHKDKPSDIFATDDAATEVEKVDNQIISTDAPIHHDHSATNEHNLHDGSGSQFDDITSEDHETSDGENAAHNTHNEAALFENGNEQDIAHTDAPFADTDDQTSSPVAVQHDKPENGNDISENEPHVTSHYEPESQTEQAISDHHESAQDDNNNVSNEISSSTEDSTAEQTDKPEEVKPANSDSSAPQHDDGENIHQDFIEGIDDTTSDVNQPDHNVAHDSENHSHTDEHQVAGVTEASEAVISQIGNEKEKDENVVHMDNLPVEDADESSATENIIDAAVSSTQKPENKKPASSLAMSGVDATTSTEVNESKPNEDKEINVINAQNDDQETATDSSSTENNLTLDEINLNSDEKEQTASQGLHENTGSQQTGEQNSEHPVSDEVVGDHSVDKDEAPFMDSQPTITEKIPLEISTEIAQPAEEALGAATGPTGLAHDSADDSEHSTEITPDVTSKPDQHGSAEISGTKPEEQVAEIINGPNDAHFSIVEVMTKPPMHSDSLVHDKVPQMEIEQTTEKQESIPDKVSAIFEEVNKLPSITNLTPNHPAMQDMEEVNHHNYEEEGSDDFGSNADVSASSPMNDQEKEGEKVAEIKPSHVEHVHSSEEVTEAGDDSSTEIAPQEQYIPGEGDCLVENKSYKSGENVPVSNNCQQECQCKNSIVHCQLQECPPPPSNDKDCMPVMQEGKCCPSYTCEHEVAYDVINTDDKHTASENDAASTDSPLLAPQSTAQPDSKPSDFEQDDILGQITPGHDQATKPEHENSANAELPGQGSHPAQIPLFDQHSEGIALNAGEDDQNQSTHGDHAAQSPQYDVISSDKPADHAIVHGDHPAQNPQYELVHDDRPVDTVVTEIESNAETTDSSNIEVENGNGEISSDDSTNKNEKDQAQNEEVHHSSSADISFTTSSPQTESEIQTDSPVMHDPEIHSDEISHEVTSNELPHQTQAPVKVDFVTAATKPEKDDFVTHAPAPVNDDFVTNAPVKEDFVTDAPAPVKEDFVTDAPAPVNDDFVTDAPAKVDFITVRPSLIEIGEHYADDVNQIAVDQDDTEKAPNTFKPEETTEGLIETGSSSENVKPTGDLHHEPQNVQTDVNADDHKPTNFEHKPVVHDANPEEIFELSTNTPAVDMTAEPENDSEVQHSSNDEGEKNESTSKPDTENTDESEPTLIHQSPVQPAVIGTPLDAGDQVSENEESDKNAHDSATTAGVPASQVPSENAAADQKPLEQSYNNNSQVKPINGENKPQEDNYSFVEPIPVQKPADHVHDEHKPEVEFEPLDQTHEDFESDDHKLTDPVLQHKPEEHIPVKPFENAPVDHSLEENIPTGGIAKPSENKPLNYTEDHKPTEHTPMEKIPEELSPVEELKPQEEIPANSIKPIGQLPVEHGEEHISEDYKPTEKIPVEHKPADLSHDEVKPTEHSPEEHKQTENIPTEHIVEENKPTEHTPMEHSPEEHKPTEHTFVEHSPEEHKPTEHSPEEHKPTEHTSVEHSPEEHMPTENIPVDHKPTEHTSVDQSPEEHTFEEHKPTQHSTVEHDSEEHKPTEHTSVEHSPEEHKPTEKIPVDLSPEEHTSAEHKPTEKIPLEHSPEEHKPSEHTPAEHDSEEHKATEHTPVEHSPEEHKPTEKIPEDLSPEEHTSAEHKPTEHTPVEHSPEEHKPTEKIPEDLSPEEHTSEEHKPTEHTPLVHISEEHKPTEHIPVEHSPEEHKPTEHTSVEHSPEEHKPTEKIPVVLSPEDHTSEEQKPTEHTPLVHISEEHKPTEHIPVEHSPEEHKPTEHTSVEHDSEEHKPTENIPVEHKINEHTPTEQIPVEHKPTESIPTEHSSGEHKPTEHTPIGDILGEHKPTELIPDDHHKPADHAPEEPQPADLIKDKVPTDQVFDEQKPSEHNAEGHLSEEISTEHTIVDHPAEAQKPIEHVSTGSEPTGQLSGEQKPTEHIPEGEKQEDHSFLKPTPVGQDQKPVEHVPEQHQEGVEQKPMEQEHKPIESAAEEQKPVEQVPEEHMMEHEQPNPDNQNEEETEGEDDMYKPGLPAYGEMPGLPYEPSVDEMFGFPDMPAMAGYDDEQASFGPGTCRYGGKVYLSAQQIPRDDPCDFCFCFRSDIICLQQSCPPPIKGCHEEAIDGFCCPRYECPVPMGIINGTTTTTTTTVAPDVASFIYQRKETTGCLVQGTIYKIGEEITSASGPCLECRCGGDNKMRCEPKACSPQPLLRKMIEAVSLRR